MAPSAVELSPSQTDTKNRVLVKPWSRPKSTSEKLEWAPLVQIDLSRFDEPGGKQELARQLYDAVTKVGFWVVTNTGIDDERVLRQFSIGNTFFKEPLEEKRTIPCNFAEGEYFGYRENSRWVGDTGVKENIEMVRGMFRVEISILIVRSSTSPKPHLPMPTNLDTRSFAQTIQKLPAFTRMYGRRSYASFLSLLRSFLNCRRIILQKRTLMTKTPTTIFAT